MEKLKKAVEELRSKSEEKDRAIAAKITELEAQENELKQNIVLMRQNSVDAELSGNIETAGKLKKDIAKTKAEITEIQEQKTAYQQAATKNNKYSKELAEIKKLATEAKENRLKKLSQVQKTLQELREQQSKLEGKIKAVKMELNQLSYMNAEGVIIKPIAHIINKNILKPTIPERDHACQTWVERSEEDFRRIIGDYEGLEN